MTFLIDRVLAPGGVRAVLQPVFDVTGAAPVVCGVECLSRGPIGTNGESAAVLFDYVRRKRREVEVDRACIGAALRASAVLRENLRIGINVHASTLSRDPCFPRWLLEALDGYCIEPSRVVLEIVEHGPAQDAVALANALATLRGEGVRLAIDDVGVGQSGLRVIVEWAPDFLKIDRFFVQGGASCARRAAVLRSVCALARSTGATTVAEGVETDAELEHVRDCGVDAVQGYGLCEPLDVPSLRTRVPQMFAPMETR